MTTAWPSFRPTLLMSPTRTPETRTVWPWPGVTACAVVNAAWSWKVLPSHGKRMRCVVQDVAAHERGDDDEPDDGPEVPGVLGDRALHFDSSFKVAGTSRPSGPSRRP